MFGCNVSTACGAAIFGILGWAAPVAAQVAGSPGCNAINGGLFNQSADITGGIATILLFDFEAGEFITVTITNATNSLAFIDVNDIFDGATGSQTRTLTIGAPGNFNVGSAIEGAGATIAWTCDPGGNAGGGVEIFDEVQTAETAIQRAEENVRLPVVPVALGTTFGAADALQALEQQRVEQAVQNRILVRQGIVELRRRADEEYTSIRAEERRLRTTLEENVRLTHKLVIDDLKKRTAEILKKRELFVDSEIEQILDQLDDGIVAGVIAIVKGLDERKSGAASDRRETEDADNASDSVLTLAFIFTGVDAAQVEQDNRGKNDRNVLRAVFVKTVSDALSETELVSRRGLTFAQQEAIKLAISEAENVNDLGGGPLVSAVEFTPIELTLRDRRRAETQLRKAATFAEDDLKKGDFKNAAGILRGNRVDIGTAGKRDANFDTSTTGSTDLGLSDGEAILLSPVNGRTLDFAIDSDFLKNAAALASGSTTGGVSAGSETKVWIKGRVALLDGDQDGADGETAEVLVGVVQRLSKQLEVGAFTGFFTSDLKANTLALRSETDALKLGLYGNYLTLNGLRLGLSGAVDFGDINTDRGGVAAKFNYRAYDLSGSIAGSMVVEKWVVSPSFSGTLSHRETDKHTDSGGVFIGGRSDTEIIATASVGAVRTFVIDSEMVRAISPNVVATGNYFFLGDDGQNDFDQLALTLGGGASVAFQNGASLSMATGVGGFGQDTMSYSGQLRLTLPF